VGTKHERERKQDHSVPHDKKPYSTFFTRNGPTAKFGTFYAHSGNLMKPIKVDLLTVLLEHALPVGSPSGKKAANSRRLRMYCAEEPILTTPHVFMV
jgi:hypothetical protein